MRVLFPLLIVFSLSSCSKNDKPTSYAGTVFELSGSAAASSFSFGLADHNLNLIYADKDSLSLVLLSMVPPRSGDKELLERQAQYLDRIGDVPEMDPLFGTHLYLVENGSQSLFYLDRQSEDKRVLKWVSKPFGEDSAWIDILPYPGKPISALPGNDGSIDLFLETDLGLLRQPLKAKIQTELLLKPFSSAGTASTLNTGQVQGFSVFDTYSKRLMLFLRSNGRISHDTVYRAGEVHYSAVLDDGKVRILVYEPKSFRILLFEQEERGPGFSIQPVTLSRGTSCLAFVSYRGAIYFLFNEENLERTKSGAFGLSLLYPTLDKKGPPYRKVQLFSASSPIRSFRVAQEGDALFLAFLQDAIKIARIDLSRFR